MLSKRRNHVFLFFSMHHEWLIFLAVVTAYDFKSVRPVSNPECGPIYYEASITAQQCTWLTGALILPGIVHWVPEQLNIKAVTGECKLIDGYSQKLCSATPSVVSSGICHRNKVNSTA